MYNIKFIIIIISYYICLIHGTIKKSSSSFMNNITILIIYKFINWCCSCENNFFKFSLLSLDFLLWSRRWRLFLCLNFSFSFSSFWRRWRRFLFRSWCTFSLLCWWRRWGTSCFWSFGSTSPLCNWGLLCNCFPVEILIDNTYSYHQLFES